MFAIVVVCVQGAFAHFMKCIRCLSTLDCQEVYASVIFVNENENENGEKRENNKFVNEN